MTTIEFIRRWLWPTPLVVEVEKPRHVEPMDKETAISVASLAGHPGFQWLLGRLETQRAALKTILNTQRQETVVDYQFLQSGVAWSGWLETQMKFATALLKRPEPQPASNEEREAFAAIASQLELIGVDKTLQQ